MKKMKNTLPVIAVLFLCTIITSCQKDLADPMVPVVPPIVTPYDSIVRLSKLIYLDPSVSPADTTGSIEFIYDSLQRVIIINGYEYFNNVSSLIDVFNYYYVGADTVAYKSDHTEVGTPYTSTVYYFYDNMQRLIKDSVISVNVVNTSSWTDQYIYGANTIIVINTNSTDTGFIGANGAIIKTVSVQPGIGHDVTTYFNYDNNPNPFYQLNIRTTYGPVPGYVNDIYGDYLLKNNLIDQTILDLLFPGSVYKDIFTYTYNASGLPETVNSSDDTGQVYEQTVLVYKKI